MRFNADVHQEEKELYVGWGNHIDFQFPVQWYDSHIMIIISCDDNILWWILIVEEKGSRYNFV